jgi:thiamine biosynthesis protein ThiS
MLTKKILLNGYSYEYADSISAYDLLIYLGFNTKLILIDYNGSILQKEQWEQVFLENNDCIEIITLAGGG